MHIESFTVAGFRSFASPVTLGPLEEVNVLYGPNNGGKGSLLRAIELYFRLLGVGELISRDQVQLLDAPDEGLLELLTTAFDRRDPQPITFQVRWSLPEKDLEAGGLYKELPCAQVSTGLEIKPSNRTWELKVKEWRLADRDIAALGRGEEPQAITFAGQVRRLLADACPFQFDQPVLPLAYAGEETSGLSQHLRNRLFDARQSLAREERARWTLFSRLAAALEPELGPGAWDTAFDRATGAADLVYLRDEDEAVRLETMGAGVVRLVGLLAELALSRARAVCLEEPEWRLSPELQRRFVELARRVLASGVGPRQLFITTHSPALAAVGAPFYLEVRDGVPCLSRQAWQSGDGLPPPGAEPSGPPLSQLIGLVESLAELDPHAIAEGTPVRRPVTAHS